MNIQFEVTRRMLRTTAHSLMAHAQVLKAYIHFLLMCMADHILLVHIFLILPIRDLINEDGKPTTPFKLTTGIKPSISHLHVLFCPCVVQKATAHAGTKALKMRHQAKKEFFEVSSL